MEALSTTLQWVQNAAFLLVGVWAFVRWRRRGTDHSAWLAATFVTLAAVIGIGYLAEGVADGSVTDRLLTGVVLTGLTAFPYLLLRFLDSFEAVPRWFRRAVAAATAALVVVGVLLPDAPDAEAALEPWFAAYVAAFVVLWTIVLTTIALRFWRGGRGQPAIVRRRLRTLALATLALSAALLLAAAGSSAGETDASPRTVVLQVVAVVAAGLFLIGFAPPGPLRTWWRRHEEHALHRASVRLMGATTSQEVVDLLVPHVRTVVAADAAVLIHRGRIVAVDGVPDSVVPADHLGREAPVELPLSAGTLQVWTSRYTPFFGEEELGVLERLAVLADLALARTELLARERAMRQDLQAVNAELESFVYTVSHDLKSPLIAIQSYLDLFLETAQEQVDPDAAFFLERMQVNTAYMEALVGDLLELSRVGRVDPAPERVDLATVAAEVAEAARRRSPDLVVDIGRLPVLWSDRQRARQLLGNLVDNAVAHGGADAPRVWIEAEAREDGIVVLVRDNGSGIPTEYRERVFGVFERLGGNGGAGDATSTGIGLAICRKIVETMGGSIWVTDHDGGAEFAFHLPTSVLADVTDRAQEVSS